MRLVVVGTGAVGRRVARGLATSPRARSVVLVSRSPERAARTAARIGGRCEAAGDLTEALATDPDAVVVATPAGTQGRVVREALMALVPAVTTADTPGEIRELLALDAEARERGVPVAVGAAYSPGLTCLLAARAAEGFDEVTEIHVARHGAGGPACARAYHAALGSAGVGWRDGTFIRRTGGSGRELCWFPGPVGALDCYRAALGEPLVLHPAFREVTRITARRAARRRDRFTARLPMLGPPPQEGGVGAVRVEVRGRRDGGTTAVVLGSFGRPSVAAAAVAAATALVVGSGGWLHRGAAGLATGAPVRATLAEIAEAGVMVSIFDGVR
ncbi:MAG: Gfo/Idh/MocA family oxidoreductase [Acidimicrobiales bacterium]